MSYLLSSSTLSSTTASPTAVMTEPAKKLAWETAVYLVVVAGITYSHSASSCNHLIFVPFAQQSSFPSSQPPSSSSDASTGPYLLVNVQKWNRKRPIHPPIFFPRVRDTCSNRDFIIIVTVCPAHHTSSLLARARDVPLLLCDALACLPIPWTDHHHPAAQRGATAPARPPAL
jgi:hypothetical protein